MPRDRTIAESAKQRSLRVPLGYLAQLDALSRVKWLAGLVMGGAAAIYVAWLLIGTRAGNRHVSPGNVSAAHAAWNDDCYACHASFRPLRSDAIDLVSLVTGGTDAVKRRTARDQACLKCHNVPAHHASERPSDVATCAACHREHGGTAADIVRPADSHCTACHADIEHHREGPGGLSPQIASVKFFGPTAAGGQPPHPEFRSLQHDPGNIKFNHWLHLQPGIAVGDAKRKQRLTDVSPDRQAAYEQFAQADGLIQLDCSACHQPGERGALMRPIAYERHCRGCHPLNVMSPMADGQSVEVPHGLSAERLTLAIYGLLFQQRQSGLDSVPPTNDESGNAPLIPGRTLGENLAQKLSQDVLQQRGKVIAAAAAKCAQCHAFRDAGDTPEQVGLRDVLPANVPPPWLAHARFDHSAHRHVECRTCHTAAYAYEKRDQPQFLAGGDLPAGYARARDNEEVMIAGMESCLTCHAPRTGTAGGARHDCAECHAYHGRAPVVNVQRHGVPAVNSPGREVGVSLELHVERSGGPAPGVKSLWYRPSGPRKRNQLVNEPGSDGPGYFLTALRASEDVLNKQPDLPHFLGAISCAGAGCHGNAKPDSPAWQSAFNTWLARDPHVQAYDVLWTNRGREMTRLLAGSEAPTEQEHRQVIEQRCVGCHTTPVPDDAWRLSLGVACESCHGQAGGWLHAHNRTGFDRQNTAGFVGTKNLDERAAACMPCHVGPNNAAGMRQVVDHDLIAAGHPRLNFEFHEYFQSLPAHWDRSRDERRQGPGLHARSWAAGEKQIGESLQSLRGAPPNEPPDFALLDCAACHHSLGTGEWRQGAGFSLQPARQALPELPAPLGAARVAWAKELLAELAIPQSRTTHDEAVRRYLAVRAVMEDFTQLPSADVRDSASRVRGGLDELGRYLGTECFGMPRPDGASPTQYELPSAYDPAELAERVQPLVAAMTDFEASLAEAVKKQ